MNVPQRPYDRLKAQVPDRSNWLLQELLNRLGPVGHDDNTLALLEREADIADLIAEANLEPVGYFVDAPN